MYKYKYIVDTKLWSYWLIQRGRPISDIFNKIAYLVYELKKRGDVYLCFDIGHSDFREKEQTYYKGHRREAMSKKSSEQQAKHAEFNNIYSCLPSIFKHLGVHVVAVPGVEADDLASLLVKKFRRDKDSRITLITNDYDWFHMVVDNDATRFYDGKTSLYKKDIQEKYGLDTRRKFSVLKSIIGDKSDNLKFMFNLAAVKGTRLFDKIYSENDNPRNVEIIKALEEYAEQHPNIKVHPNHVADGRTTIKEAFLSNMKVADPFTDLSNLTELQRDRFMKALSATVSPDLKKFNTAAINILGHPVQLTDVAKRVYNVV